MKKACPNCTKEVDANYCTVCGQKYFESHSFQNALTQVLDVIDLRKGVFSTLYHLLIKPGQLVRDFLNCKTKPYIHPFALILIIVGLQYLIDELSLLGFLVVSNGNSNQFQDILDVVLNTCFVLVLPVFRFYRFRFIENAIIYIYFLSGFFFLDYFALVSNVIFFIREIDPNSWLTQIPYFLVVIWFLFYLWQAFKGKRREMIMFIVGFALSSIIYEFIGTEVVISNADELSTDYGDGYMVFDIEGFIDRDDCCSRIVSSEFTNPLYSDLNNDGVRNGVVVYSNDLDEEKIAVFDVNRTEVAFFFLSDYSVEASIIDISAVEGVLRVELQDSTKAEVFWDDVDFRMRLVK